MAVPNVEQGEVLAEKKGGVSGGGYRGLYNVDDVTEAWVEKTILESPHQAFSLSWEKAMELFECTTRQPKPSSFAQTANRYLDGLTTTDGSAYRVVRCVRSFHVSLIDDIHDPTKKRVKFYLADRDMGHAKTDLQKEVSAGYVARVHKLPDVAPPDDAKADVVSAAHHNEKASKKTQKGE